MSEKKSDLRVRYTLSVIRESFVKLLHQKSVTKITVKEICELAGINRATFYSHYKDQYDLLHSIEQALIEDIRHYLYDICPNQKITDTSKQVLTNIMEYIKENVEICTVLLSSNSNLDFQEDILALVRDQLIAEWQGSDVFAPGDAAYIFTYVANGSVGIIKAWMAEGMRKTPAEVADLIWILSPAGQSGGKSIWDRRS